MENCTQKTTIPTKSKTKPLIIASEFNGNMISFNQYGWFNATEVAKLHDKDVFEWTRLPSTISYIKALESTYGKIPYVKTSKARSDRGGGTWMHPKLAIVFARWLSAEFAVWCDSQIESIVYGNRAEKALQESELMKLFISQKHDAHKEMMDALVQARAEEGKITNAKHFINENRLCNWAVVGKFESVDEVHLSQLDALLLAFARRFNEGLINACVDYATRKMMLLNAIEKKRHALVKKLNTATALAKVAL